MNEENIMYAKKMQAWLQQQEASIQDSRDRINFHERQIQTSKMTIEACNEQLRLDLEIRESAQLRFNKWCEEEGIVSELKHCEGDGIVKEGIEAVADGKWHEANLGGK